MTINQLLYRRNAFIIARVFDALCAHPYGLTMQELIWHVYQGEDEPDYASTAISARICDFNKRTRRNRLGLGIHGHGGPGSKYQIWVVRP